MSTESDSLIQKSKNKTVSVQLVENSDSQDIKICSLQGLDVFIELLTLIFTILDMSFVGILVVRHYRAEVALEAWAMLLPVFLATFGMQLFFEKYPPEKHWYNELLNIPLLGPIFW